MFSVLNYKIVRLSIHNITLFCGDFIADKIIGEPAVDSNLVDNLCYAKDAMDYTHRALPRGASNIKNAKATWDDILYMRAFVDIKVIFSMFLQTLSSEEIGDICINEIKKHGVGNCGEQTRIVQQYLTKDKNVQSERVYLFEKVSQCKIDHTFIFIGRGTKDLKDIKMSKSVVVLDPWAHRFFPIAELDQQMDEILTTVPLDPLIDLNSTRSADCELHFRHDNYYKYKESKLSIKPGLSKAEKMAVERQVRDYEIFKHRASIHQRLEQQAKRASDFAQVGGGVALLLLQLAGSTKKPFGVLSGICIVGSTALYYSSDFFKKHATTYQERARKIWQSY